MQNLWRSRRFQYLVLPLLIFLLAFLPRAIYPVSRSMLWYYRAIEFSDALAVRDWIGTYSSCHPGVTVMALGAIGVRLFGWRWGLSSDQLMGVAPTKPGMVDGAVTAGVISLTLVISLCVVLAYFLLSRIAGRKVALVGSCLLAMDPFHMTHSKAFHVDGLLATFMLVSVLFLFNYLYREKWTDLVLSGVFGGLALLTKNPSLFLVPYAALAIGVWKAVEILIGSAEKGRWRTWARWLGTLIRAVLIWCGVAVVVFVALWPAMWVQPLHVLSLMRDRTAFHVETVHLKSVYFNGRASFDDPGLPFYLATMAWKTTLVTLPMIVAALLFALIRFRRGEHSRMVWLLAAYVLCFNLQMGLSAHKAIRYILPVSPVLDVLAALGLVWSAEALGRVRRWRRVAWLPAALIAVVLVLQAGFVFRHHPYYGTHHNHLLGGSRVAKRILPLQDRGEGLDLAAQYLNSLPRAAQSRAMVFTYSADFFGRYFLGHTEIAPSPWTNYRVYYVDQVMRRLGGEEWMEAWDADRQTAPLWTVAFDGVTYVWIYGSAPNELAAGGPEYETDFRFGEGIRLKRIRFSSDTVSPGDPLEVVLFWESDREIKDDYTVFCHVVSEHGELVAQHDGPPIYGARPTPSWRVGETIEDGHVIYLGSDLAPGEYELSVGMYESESVARVPIYTSAGERLPEDRVIVSVLRVEAAETPD
jgi:hypothetical protein